MPESNFVYEEGEAIDTGRHGETDYVFHQGDPVPNEGVSSLVFESGTGLGAAWVELTGLGVTSNDGNAAVVNGKIYFAPGEDATVHEYDISSDSWSTAFSRTHSDNSFAWVAYNGDLCKLKGSEGGDKSVKTYRYTTGGTSTRLANAGNGVDEVQGAVLGDQILVPSGEVNNADSTNASYSEYYDVSADAWTRTADIPQPVRSYAATEFQGDAWILCGDETPLDAGNDYGDKVQIYDISADSWSSGPTAPYKAVGPSACTDSSGNLYLTGGQDNSGNSLDFFYEYDGSSWNRLPDVPVAGSTDHEIVYDPGTDAVYVVTPDRLFRYYV